MLAQAAQNWWFRRAKVETPQPKEPCLLRNDPKPMVGLVGLLGDKKFEELFSKDTDVNFGEELHKLPRKP